MTDEQVKAFAKEYVELCNKHGMHMTFDGSMVANEVEANHGTMLMDDIVAIDGEWWIRLDFRKFIDMTRKP